ncbi:MAG: hypothetical protein PW786_04745 [Arachidicoccus sp.]|nr:hypothetical protein [Arachidicoccus sp.]
MIKYFCILLQLRNNVLSNNESNDCYYFAKDFILPIGIAILAAWMAYYIFVEETKRDREKEEKKKLEERSNKLLYFSTIIKKCIELSIQQKKNIENYIKRVDENSVEFHMMNFVPLNDLKRICTKMNLEEYLQAYIDKIPDSGKKSVEEFNKIISSLDFLYEFFKKIPKQMEKSQLHDYNRKLSFTDYYNKSWNLTGEIMLQIQKEDGNLFNKFQRILGVLKEKMPKDNYDLEFHYQYFLAPLNELCADYFIHTTSPEQKIIELTILTRDGMEVYEQIKSQNSLIANDFRYEMEQIETTLEELIKIVVQTL